MFIEPRFHGQPQRRQVPKLQSATRPVLQMGDVGVTKLAGCWCEISSLCLFNDRSLGFSYETLCAAFCGVQSTSQSRNRRKTIPRHRP